MLITATATKAKTMEAAVLERPGHIAIHAVPLPSPGDAEVRVRIQGCGVCASNLATWKGAPWFNYPMKPGAMGHEAYGWVDAVGLGAPESLIGQRVAMLSHAGYAEYDVAPVSQVLPLPESLSSLPFLGEPLGCALNIFNRSGIEAGDTVGIVGVGFLGALLTQLA